jgi:predicted RNA-binding protein with PUA-like domain
MQYWLFKSEPYKWSWDHQKKAGDKGTEWDGVRNYQARNFMRDMKIGDRGFFYHSNEGKEIVGIVEVCKEAHPDSTTDDARWECVDIRALADVPRPVTLAEIKETEVLSDMSLVTSMRLSVQPVKRQEWNIVCEMAGIDPDTLKPL